MIDHNTLSACGLFGMLRRRLIQFAGNQQLKIYGTLRCKQGKRMNLENRVFFSSETEAVENGFRPCGHCMREKYQLWSYSK